MPSTASDEQAFQDQACRERANVDLPAMPAGEYGVEIMLHEQCGVAATVIRIGVKESAVDAAGYVQIAKMRIK